MSDELKQLVISGFKEVKSRIRSNEHKTSDIEVKHASLESAVLRLEKETDSSYNLFANKFEELKKEVSELKTNVAVLASQQESIKENLKDTLQEVLEERPSRTIQIDRSTQLEFENMSLRNASLKKLEEIDKEDDKGKWAAIATIVASVIALLGSILTMILK